VTATLVREYVHPTGILSHEPGHMQVLANGNVLSAGAAPRYSRVGEDGKLIFNGRFPAAGQSYRAYRG